MLKECRKDSIQYKMAALDATGDILEQYGVDRFKDIVEIVDKFITVRFYFIEIYCH